MDRRLIGKPLGGANPDMKAAALGLSAEIAIELDRPQLDRPLALVVAPHRVRHQREHPLLDGGLARNRLGLRDLRHPRLVAQAGLVAVKRDRHGEDRFAMLEIATTRRVVKLLPSRMRSTS